MKLKDVEWIKKYFGKKQKRIDSAEIMAAAESSWAILHAEMWKKEEMDRSPFWTMAFLRGARWAEKRMKDEQTN